MLVSASHKIMYVIICMGVAERRMAFQAFTTPQISQHGQEWIGLLDVGQSESIIKG